MAAYAGAPPNHLTDATPLLSSDASHFWWGPLAWAKLALKIWGGLLKTLGRLIAEAWEASTELQLESNENLKNWGGLSTPKPDSNFAHAR